MRFLFHFPIVCYLLTLLKYCSMKKHHSLQVTATVFSDEEKQSIDTCHLCHPSQLFNGSWSYHERVFITKNPFGGCPRALEKVSSMNFLKDHHWKYPCYNQSYFVAHYHTPSSCAWMTLQESLRQLQGERIVLVGDSLMGQLFVALLCSMDSFGFSWEKDISVNYFHEILLRSDLPCYQECLENTKFSDPDHVVPCYACNKGIVYPFVNDSAILHSYSHFWLAKIPKNTTALIISAGAWYNTKKHIADPLATFTEMIDILGPIFGTYISEYHMRIYWVEVPDIVEGIGYFDFYERFGWSLFPSFNDYARKKLSPYGVTVIQHTLATNTRRKVDMNITEPFRLHWCNPGKSMIPEFINTAIMHLHATDLLQRKQSRTRKRHC